MKKYRQRMLSILLILTMVTATWMESVPNAKIQAAAKPSLNRSGVNLLIGKTTTLKLKKKIKGATVRFQSKNKKIATVNQNGKVKGIRKGNTKVSANVTAKGKRYNLSCNVKVVQKANRLTITHNKGKTAKNIQMEAGDKTSLDAKMAPKSSNDFVASWKSKNAKVATVNKKGTVTAVAPGVTTITATTFGKAKKTVTITVVENAKVPSATATPATPSQTGKPSPTPLAGHTPVPDENALPDEVQNGMYRVYENTFETETTNFFDSFFANPFSWDGSGTVSVSRSTNASYEGRYSLRVTGRTAGWHGAQKFVNDILMEGNRYFFRAYVRQNTGQSQTVKMALNYGSETDYPLIAEATCESGKWTRLQGFFDMNVSGQFVFLYFEMPNHATADFYIDNVSIWEEMEDFEPVDTSLKEAYQELYSVGAAVNPDQLKDETMLAHVNQHYDSITLENHMKPSYILGSSANLIDVGQAEFPVPEGYTETKVPKLNFTNVDECLEIAKKNNLKMRGHTLVWYSQTPDWFFRTGYSSNGSLVSPDVMDKRLENYVKQVLLHIKSKYPGIVYAWDVVNEAFSNDGHANYEQALRGSGSDESNWYEIYKDDSFIIKAFTYARRYQEEGVTLFYNDYNEYVPEKRENIYTLVNKLNEQNLIDGIGMQSHLDVAFPTISLVGEAIDRFSSIDEKLEIQLTELDVTINYGGRSGYTLDDQTRYYKELMDMVVAKRRSGVNITNVTFWGLYDQVSWRSTNRPLLFTTKLFKPKDAYFSVLSAVTD